MFTASNFHTKFIYIKNSHNFNTLTPCCANFFSFEYDNISSFEQKMSVLTRKGTYVGRIEGG